MPTGGTELLERVADLAPVLDASATTTEAAGTLGQSIVDAMRAAELFRMWVPEPYGGLETPVPDTLEVLIELARHDGAASWSAMIANTTALLAARLEPEVAQTLFGSPDSISAGFAQPVGTAQPQDGGLRVEGRWPWGSFTRHATTVGAGVMVTTADGAVRPRFVFLDPVDIEFLDTWHVVGLRGTGSGDYSAAGAFVPDGHWVDLASPEPPVVDSALYRFSFFGMLAAGVASTAIGMAQAALDAFLEIAAVKVPQGSTRTLAERPTAQADAARAEATIGSATAYLQEVVACSWDRAAGGEITVDDKRLIRLAATDATQRCADAVNRLYRTAGGEAVYERCPMEKLFRDVNVATQHAMVAERIYETVGRISLGLETDTRLL